MPDDADRKIVSLNDMTDLIHTFTAGKISDLLEPLDLKAEAVESCDCRCGCVGNDCSCRGSVSVVSINQDAWEQLKQTRMDYALELKRKLED